MFGSKVAATSEDKKILIAVCLWDGSLKNTECLSLLHSMYQNCGRRLEIAVLKWSLCKLRKIVEQNSFDYKTLNQFVL